MNLDELKSTWKAYDDKLLASRQLNERMILLMLKDRSKGTLARMARHLQLAGIVMTAVIVFFSAAIVGNAFDYERWYLYIPSVFYIGLATVALMIVVKTYYNLSRVSLNQHTLYDSLKTVLQWHEKAQSALSKVWMLCILAGFMFTFSMIARKFETYSPLKISLTLGAQAALVLLFYGLARWLFNAFEDQIGQELRENIQELEQVKSIL
ncbi:hypothetical protein ACFQ4C_04810 [Larkinella insperata]|uniref:Uncharacterized protein n=1 Tax=Larkinella insperata TaxID=332158 RepID=A0ABW3QEE1_9BACT|nr:hypothetical protein [Larkinella insperata]